MNRGNCITMEAFEHCCGTELRAVGGDTDLKIHHLRNSALNATCISQQIQNEMISVCNDLILAEFVAQVNAAKCFSILADQTADVSGTKQFSLYVRYVDKCAGKVVEDFFLQFVPLIMSQAKAWPMSLLSD